MSDLFVCGSRGPKSVPVLHHFTLLPASPDLGAQGVPGDAGDAGDAGDVACFGSFCGGRRCRGCRRKNTPIFWEFFWRQVLSPRGLWWLSVACQGTAREKQSKGKQGKTKESNGQQKKARHVACHLHFANLLLPAMIY